VVRRYFDRLVRAAACDEAVNSAFVDVIAMLASPESLMRPALAARVLGRRHPTPSLQGPLPARRPSAVAA
jgi:hypothetical protein